jgi:hypothetical protein
VPTPPVRQWDTEKATRWLRFFAVHLGKGTVAGLRVVAREGAGWALAAAHAHGIVDVLAHGHGFSRC